MQVRNWIFVEDMCAGIDTVLDFGEAGDRLQPRRPGGAPQYRGRSEDPRAGRPRRVADRVRRRIASDTTVATRWHRSGRRSSAGSRRSSSTRGSSAPSSGTARTNGGGARSARASTASTTSASTAAPSADAAPPRDEARRAGADRAGGSRRRARVPGRDVPRRALARAGHRDGGRPGEPLPLGAGTSSAAFTSRPAPARRSWSAACAARSGTSRSTFGATPTRTASGRATS